MFLTPPSVYCATYHQRDEATCHQNQRDARRERLRRVGFDGEQTNRQRLHSCGRDENRRRQLAQAKDETHRPEKPYRAVGGGQDEARERHAHTAAVQPDGFLTVSGNLC